MDSLDEAIKAALEQGIDEMISQANEEGLNPTNALIMASNEAAPLLGFNVRVLFGAVEVGSLRGYPLVITSFLTRNSMELVSRDSLLDTINRLAQTVL